VITSKRLSTTKILVTISTRGGFSANRRNITTLWLFDSLVQSFFLDPTPCRSDSHALWLKQGVSAELRTVFCGLG